MSCYAQCLFDLNFSTLNFSHNIKHFFINKIFPTIVHHCFLENQSTRIYILDLCILLNQTVQNGLLEGNFGFTLLIPKTIFSLIL